MLFHRERWCPKEHRFESLDTAAPKRWLKSFASPSLARRFVPRRFCARTSANRNSQSRSRIINFRRTQASLSLAGMKKHQATVVSESAPFEIRSPLPRITIEAACPTDREEIYRLRHEVYA